MNEPDSRFEELDEYEANKFPNRFLKYKMSCDPRKMRNKSELYRKKIKTFISNVLNYLCLSR